MREQEAQVTGSLDTSPTQPKTQASEGQKAESCLHAFDSEESELTPKDLTHFDSKRLRPKMQPDAISRTLQVNIMRSDLS